MKMRMFFVLSGTSFGQTAAFRGIVDRYSSLIYCLSTMKIKIIFPVITDIFDEEAAIEAAGFAAPDTEIDVQHLDRGTVSIECLYDGMLASPDIVEKAVQAEKDGFDAVFVDCFGDFGVEAAREMVSIPVTGGFQPAALTANIIAGRWSIVTVTSSGIPMLRGLAARLGLDKNLASIRHIDTPVLELTDKQILKQKLLEQVELAVKRDGAEAIVLGCTGLMGLAAALEQEAAERGFPAPVVDPTAAAIGFLELLHRSRLSHSRITYEKPPEKDRKI